MYDAQRRIQLMRDIVDQPPAEVRAESSKVEVILLKAALIRPSSSEDVTGSRAVFPCAIAWVASVKAVTGAVMRLDNQAASSMATQTVSIPPIPVMYSSVMRKPCDSADRSSWSYIHIDVAYGLVRGQIQNRLAMAVQVGRHRSG